MKTIISMIVILGTVNAHASNKRVQQMISWKSLQPSIQKEYQKSLLGSQGKIRIAKTSSKNDQMLATIYKTKSLVAKAK